MADLAAYPWSTWMPNRLFELMPSLARWKDRMSRRPAVEKAMAVPLG